MKKVWLASLMFSLTLTSACTPSGQRRPGPIVRHVHDGHGGYRIEVVDRPSNASAGNSAQPWATTRPTDASSDEAATVAERTLHTFAAHVTAGNVTEAASLLSPSLRGAYAFQDYAPLRNTPSMEILEAIDLTDQWPPDLSGFEPGDVLESRVYYVKAKYGVLGIIESRLVDGEPYHHKATVARLSSGWVISELSTTRPPRH